MNRTPESPRPAMSRREAIKKTIIFSTGFWALADRLQAQTPTTQFSDGGLDFLAIGDFGTGNVNQRAVAHAMAEFSKKLKRPLTAVLALGDNFYGKLMPERFAPGF